MGTRATYQFKDKEYGTPKTTVYIHWDGYPSGAASYFWAALNHENQRGGLATTFIRANDHAEITKSHDYHADTEWRYDVTGNGAKAVLKVSQRIYDTDPDYLPQHDKWKGFYSGTLGDFIADHPELIDHIESTRTASE